MTGEKAKLLCSFGGKFVSQQGRAFYLGGKTRLVSIDRSASFRLLNSKMSELCDADPSSLDIRFQLTDGSLDTRLVSVETDDDVRNMMEEFDDSRKIPIFLFGDKAQNTDEDIAAEDNLPSLEPTEIDAFRETETLAAERSIEFESGPSGFQMSFRRDHGRYSLVGPSMSGDMFRRDSQSLVVGQEYEDVQAFRNSLVSAAIAANFELHMIRSDQRRVTARCSAEGCTWRVHASKLPQVTTFRIRTLTAEHTCVRSEDAGHRQATAKWIANCIRDKLRQNRNYKPREILNDIHREYGVLITYKRAFLGREKALEELRAEPVRNLLPVENYETVLENQAEAQAWGGIDDLPRKKRAYKVRHPKDARQLHCTRCNQIGHNRRTCDMPDSHEDGTG